MLFFLRIFFLAFEKFHNQKEQIKTKKKSATCSNFKQAVTEASLAPVSAASQPHVHELDLYQFA